MDCIHHLTIFLKYRVLQFSIQTYSDFSFRMSKWRCWLWPSKGCLGEAELTILYEQQEESQSVTLFCSSVWEPSDTCCQLKLQIDVSEVKKIWLYSAAKRSKFCSYLYHSESEVSPLTIHSIKTLMSIDFFLVQWTAKFGFSSLYSKFYLNLSVTTKKCIFISCTNLFAVQLWESKRTTN